jgi:hypothetical protein
MTPASRPAPRPAALRPARLELASAGVVASYIHDISARSAPRRTSSARRGRRRVYETTVRRR